MDRLKPNKQPRTLPFSSFLAKVTYQGVLTTVLVWLDLQYKSVRSPWTTVFFNNSVTFFQLKRIKEVTHQKIPPKNIAKLSYSAQKRQFRTFYYPYEQIEIHYCPTVTLKPFGRLHFTKNKAVCS